MKKSDPYLHFEKIDSEKPFVDPEWAVAPSRYKESLVEVYKEEGVLSSTLGS